MSKHSPQRVAITPEPLTGQERRWLQETHEEHTRPATRSECVDGPRPCPWVGCRYHLGLDVTMAGQILVDDDREPWECEQTCALDLAAQGKQSLQAIGDIWRISRERVRQIEAEGIAHVRRTEAGRVLLAEHARIGLLPTHVSSMWSLMKPSGGGFEKPVALGSTVRDQLDAGRHAVASRSVENQLAELGAFEGVATPSKETALLITACEECGHEIAAEEGADPPEFCSSGCRREALRRSPRGSLAPVADVHVLLASIDEHELDPARLPAWVIKAVVDYWMREAA